MEKAAYRRACLIRHPELQHDLLTFHQTFPVCLWLLSATRHPPLEAFPKSVQSLVEMRGHHLIALVPRAVADLTPLCHLGDLARECPPCYTLLTAQNGEPYFTVLGRTQRDYEHAKEALLHKWPQIPERILLWGDLQWGLQPTLFIKPRPSFPDGNEAWVEEDRRMLCLWLEQLVRLISSPELVGLVPVYGDTTKEDMLRLWPAIESVKRQRSPTRRNRPNQHAVRLQVWDIYQQSRNFVQVARHLHMNESTVKSVYAMASRDILGAPDHRGRRQRLASKAMSAHHCERCSTCRQAQTFEELCPQARAYACEHETPLLGRPSGDMDSFDARKARRDG
jgi:hypothetical protein